MKFKGIRISPHPPPRSLRQNPGRLVTGGPVFPVPGRRRARSARTRGWSHRTEEIGERLGARTQLLSTTSRDAFLVYFTKGQHREGADRPSWPRPRPSRAHPGPRCRARGRQGRARPPRPLLGRSRASSLAWNTLLMAGLGTVIPDYISAEKLTDFKNSANSKSTLGDN